MDDFPKTILFNDLQLTKIFVSDNFKFPNEFSPHHKALALNPVLPFQNQEMLS